MIEKARLGELMIQKSRLLKELVELDIRLYESCLGLNDPEFRGILMNQIQYIRTFLVEKIDQYREDSKPTSTP